jgi:D-alanine-D-alanine ligase
VNLKKSEKISILRGGISDEKEISTLTANQVHKTLQKKYDTTLINVDHDCNKLINDLIRSKPDKVFNCLHGIFGEDGQLQSILNYLKIPYTHSGVLASSIAMNKVVSKYIYKSLGIRFPQNYDINSKFTNSSYPFIVKPICGGSSKNLFKIENEKQLNDFKNNNNNDLNKYMVEEYIDGKEITVGILEDKICGIMEIIFDSEIYDFKNKYQTIAKHVLDPKLPENVKQKLKDISLKIHRTLNCKCISRLDFRYNNKSKELFILEINTQPGLTQNSLLPEMAKSKGTDFLELCEILLTYAECEFL